MADNQKILYEFQVDGAAVVVAARRPPGVRSTSTEDVLQKAEAKLEDVLRVADRVAVAFRRAVENAPIDKAEIEFGLSFNGKTSAMFVEFEQEATFKITIGLIIEKPRAGSAEREPSDRS